MKIKFFVAAAILFATMTSAFATVVELKPDGAGNYTAEFGQSHNAAFEDTYTFTPQLGNGLVDSVLSSIGFTNASNINFTSVTLNGVALTISNGVIDSAATLTQIPASGLLTLIVKGTSGSAASYSGVLNVTAVPEPETYAMMLAGLGLVGFAAARRRKAATAA